MVQVLLMLTTTHPFIARALPCPRLNIEVVEREPGQEVLLGDRMSFGGFGGVSVKFTEMDDHLGVLAGGRGGFLVNHLLGFGGGGYGLTNRWLVETNYPEDNYWLNMGYGGFVMDVIFASRKLVHGGINVLIGGGGITYTSRYDEFPMYDDGFFVMEPGMDLTLNVAKHFRIDVGGSYRWIYGADLQGISDAGLSGPAAHFTFKFGEF